GPRPAGPAPAAPPTAAPAAPGADADHHVEVLARTIWGEARGGSRLGMEAVAACVLNRLRRKQPGRFGASVAEVCLKPLQFSCWNEGDPNLPKLKAVDERDERFRLCLEIARRAVAGTLADPVSGSDHYHTVSVSPAWSAGRRPVRRIDDHLFFNDVP
ncbi:cell wall hydrolase, partial [Aquincola sp. MAHUQ-54]